MIHEVDEALKALVTRDVLNGLQVDLALDAPTKEWGARRTGPTLNIYLYEIREDPSRREVQYEEIRDESGAVVERRQPPRRIRLNYAVSAWAQRPEDEHRILSAALSCFLKNDVLPREVLSGSLADQPLPIRVTVSIPNTAEFQMSLNDMWARLDGDYHAAIDLVVTVPFDAAQATGIGPPVLEEPRIRVSDADGGSDEAARRRRSGRAASERRSAIVEEVLSGGTPEQPGRTLRIRGTAR